MLIYSPAAMASPSSRRAWIEIPSSSVETQSVEVALLAEGVDRNMLYPSKSTVLQVALLAEGVDRNIRAFVVAGPKLVALLAEGVDRNSILWIFVSIAASRPPRGGRG